MFVVLNPKYAFIAAYLKGLEAKNITSEHFDKMMTVSNLQDALAIIGETDIGSYLEESPPRTFDEIDERLWRFLSQRITHVESFKFLPRDIKKILNLYVVKYDVLNVKAALRGISNGKKARMIPIGIIYHNGLLNELSNAENVDDIIQLLTQCRLGDYIYALEEYKMDKSEKATLLVEAGLDSQYYRNLLYKIRRTKGRSVLMKAFGLLIDLTNLRTISRAIIQGMGAGAAEFIVVKGYRIKGKAIKQLVTATVADMAAKLEDTGYTDIAKEMATAYDKSKNIAAVDQIIDKHKFVMLKELLSPRLLFPTTMVWHLVLKETEMRNLRLVLKAIVDGVPVQEIRNYLVL